MSIDKAISMYVPARNAGQTLSACLEAIRSQTRIPDELFILLDTRSSDNTVEEARRSGITIVEQTGSTLGSARNQAIAVAKHRWLACCDSDVIIESDWLEKLSGRRDEQAAGIGGCTLERVCSPFDAWRSIHMPHNWGEHAFANPFMLVSEVLFDGEALRAVGGYRDDLNYYEDSDLCQRLRDAGYDLFYEPSAKAKHQRRDTLIGLLRLRWVYSEYRQKHLMDRYSGLVEKMLVNREYVLNTLSRSLAWGHEELSYISFLLFFHHLVLDLRSLLSRRPMLTAGVRARYEQELLNSVADALGQQHVKLAEWAKNDLQELFVEDRNEVVSMPTFPSWESYIEAMQSAIGDLCEELTPSVMSIINSSAQYIHEQIGLDDVQRLPLSDATGLAEEVQSIPIRSFVDEQFCRSITDLWPDTDNLQVIEPVAENERAVLDKAEIKRGDEVLHAVAVMAHLESRAEPLTFFDEIDPQIKRAVVCYRPPQRFVPGLDIMSAASLASSAVGAGWTIERFDTLVGRTRLMLSR